jgi:hypothetical protein
MKPQYSVFRSELVSDRCFEDVIKALERATVSIDDNEFQHLAANCHIQSEFGGPGRYSDGPGTFVRLLKVDHGHWRTPTFGEPSKSILYVLGNPLTARHMQRHNIAAELNAPIRLVVFEGANEKTHVTYDLPTTILSTLPLPVVASSAESLDRKLVSLAKHILGLGS